MEVVGDHGELEAGLLGLSRVLDELRRAVLLGRQGVAELGHVRRVSPEAAYETRSASSTLRAPSRRTRYSRWARVSARAKRRSVGDSGAGKSANETVEARLWRPPRA